MSPPNILATSRALRSHPSTSPNPDNVVEVPVPQTTPSASGGSGESSGAAAATPVMWSLEPLVLAESHGPIEGESRSEVNSFAEGCTFVPFMKEPHILNSYVFGDTPSKPFSKGHHVFRPVNKPIGEWIRFSIEAVRFLSSHRYDPLDPGQFASLLLDNLSDESFKNILSKVPSEKVFVEFQSRCYSIEEAARDYKRFQADSTSILDHGRVFARYYHWLASTDNGILLLGPYGLSPRNLAIIRASRPDLFDTAGSLRIREDETDKIDTMSMEIRKLSALVPQQKINQSHFKSRSRDTRQLPSVSDWYKGSLLAQPQVRGSCWMFLLILIAHVVSIRSPWSRSLP